MKAQTREDIALVTRAMRKAQERGVNPYDAHAAQDAEYKLKWKRRAAYRAARDAKREAWCSPALTALMLAEELDR